jgi:hypothetical protein
VARALPVLFVIVALGLAERSAQACAACGCGDQTLTAFGVEKPYKNRVRLSVETRYMDIKFGAAAEGALNRTLRTTLAASWVPHKRITFAALLPWMSEWVTPLRPRPMQSVNGLGDLEVSGRVLLWTDRNFMAAHLLWATVGIKTPTGPRVLDDHGIPIDADLQPSSGSWDPFAGITYGYFGGLVSTFASATYRYTTPGYGGYHFGPSFGASAVAQVQPWWWAAGAAGFDLRYAEPDRFANGHSTPDTGGTVLYFSPALLFTPTRSGNFFLRASVSIPFLQHLNGLQLMGTQATLAVALDLN